MTKINDIVKTVDGLKQEYNVVNGKVSMDIDKDESIHYFTHASLMSNDKLAMIDEVITNSAFTMDWESMFNFKNTKADPIKRVEIRDYEFIQMEKSSGAKLFIPYNDKIKSHEDKLGNANFVKINDNPIVSDEESLSQFISSKGAEMYQIVLNLTNSEMHFAKKLQPINHLTNNSKDEFTVFEISNKFISGMKRKKVKETYKYSEVFSNVYVLPDSKEAICCAEIIAEDIEKLIRVEQAFIFLDV